MAEIKDIVKLAVDGYKGKVEKYSVGQSQELLRQALVEANGGSTVLDYKKIRDGKCTGLFSLLEETLSRTVGTRRSPGNAPAAPRSGRPVRSG